jgi:hypothetical protein
MNTAPQNPNPPNRPDPLAVALAALDPAPHGFDFNALMFAAGRASKSRALAFWRAATAVAALAAAGFALAYSSRPPVVVERVVVVERTPEVVAAPSAVPPVMPAVAPPAAPPPVAPRPTTEVPPIAPPEWSYDDAPEPGAAARWLTMRNEVLTVGLGVLPDRGRTLPAPPKRQ